MKFFFSRVDIPSKTIACGVGIVEGNTAENRVNPELTVFLSFLGSFSSGDQESSIELKFAQITPKTKN